MIEVVTSPGCSHCVSAKRWLKANDVPFAELDAVRIGQTGGVPVLRIDGRQAVLGWNEELWDEKIRGGARHRGAAGIELAPSGDLMGAVKEFFTTPAPPSEWHRTGVTAVGAGLSYVASPSPTASLLAGAATVLAGHFAAKRWEVKSIGYGIMAEGAAKILVAKWQERSLPADARLATEAIYLAWIEEDTVTGGVIVGGVRNTGYVSVAHNPTHVRLPNGLILAQAEYDRRHPEKLEQARARGRARRGLPVPPGQGGVVPGQPQGQPQGQTNQPPPGHAISEESYLSRVEAAGERGDNSFAPSGTAAAPEPTHILLPDRTRTTIAEYRARFPDRVRAAWSRGQSRKLAAENDRLAKAEAKRVEDDRLAKAEAKRVEDDRLAKAEAKRVEDDRLAKAEAKRVEDDRLAAEAKRTGGGDSFQSRLRDANTNKGEATLGASTFRSEAQTGLKGDGTKSETVLGATTISAQAQTGLKGGHSLVTGGPRREEGFSFAGAGKAVDPKRHPRRRFP